MSPHGSLLQFWRTSGNARRLGLLGIVLHLFFSIVHLSAETEAILLGGGSGEGLGLLSICTAEGVKTVPFPGVNSSKAAANDQADKPSQQHCPICGSAAVASAVSGKSVTTVDAAGYHHVRDTGGHLGRQDVPLTDVLRYSMSCRGPPGLPLIA